MPKKAGSSQRREKSLTRERIIEAAIELLDRSGESGLTFRSLSERLATGPGAIYWHIAHKSDLLTAACDSIIARAVELPLSESTPEDAIRALALGVFDAMHAHPWLGSTFTLSPGQLPIVRMVESMGQQVRALGVQDEEQWATVSVLMSYILGVCGQNAANAQLARTQGFTRSNFLEEVSTAWSQLDPAEYPFARSIAGTLRIHDDRVDFLFGINIILGGIKGLPSDPIESIIRS